MSALDGILLNALKVLRSLRIILGFDCVRLHTRSGFVIGLLADPSGNLRSFWLGRNLLRFDRIGSYDTHPGFRFGAADLDAWELLVHAATFGGSTPLPRRWNWDKSIERFVYREDSEVFSMSKEHVLEVEEALLGEASYAQVIANRHGPP